MTRNPTQEDFRSVFLFSLQGDTGIFGMIPYPPPRNSISTFYLRSVGAGSSFGPVPVFNSNNITITTPLLTDPGADAMNGNSYEYTYLILGGLKTN